MPYYGSTSSTIYPIDTALKTGEYYPIGMFQSIVANDGTQAINRLLVAPWVVYRTQRYDRIAVYVSTNGTSGSVMRLGIYNEGSDGLPGTVLLDAGTVAIDTGAASIKAITIDLTINPGRYWSASCVQGANSGNIQRSITVVYNQFLTTAFRGGALYQDNVTGAFSSSPTLSSSVGLNPAAIGMRAAA